MEKLWHILSFLCIFVMPQKKLSAYALNWVETKTKAEGGYAWYAFQCLQKLVTLNKKRKEGPSLPEVTSIRVRTLSLYFVSRKLTQRRAAHPFCAACAPLRALKRPFMWIRSRA